MKFFHNDSKLGDFLKSLTANGNAVLELKMPGETRIFNVTHDLQRNLIFETVAITKEFGRPPGRPRRIRRNA